MNWRLTICDVLLCLLLLAGCNQPQATEPAPTTQVAVTEDQLLNTAGTAGSNPQSTISGPQLPVGYAPTRISILPLTELSRSVSGDQPAMLNVYVCLLDGFGSQIKAPGIIRFELYRYVPRSAEPKGQRIAIWPDINLKTPAENNKYWRDFLRAYEFRVEAEIGRDETFVLEATWMTSDGRLTAESLLKAGR
jgi:hypothetical protein